MESGDRESLGGLLSKRCPSQIDWPETLEFYLAFRGWRIKDPIFILGEAYARCQVPETRHTLAASLRRGFAGLGIRGEDDVEFVNNAMRWYGNEKGHLVVNAKYTMNEMRGITPNFDTSYTTDADTENKLMQLREPLFRTNTILRGRRGTWVKIRTDNSGGPLCESRSGHGFPNIDALGGSPEVIGSLLRGSGLTLKTGMGGRCHRPLRKGTLADAPSLTAKLSSARNGKTCDRFLLPHMFT